MKNVIELLRYLPVMLCSTGVLLPLETRAQSASLLLVNDQETAVKSSVINLPAALVYDAISSPPGIPLRVSTDKGIDLPVVPGPDGKSIRSTRKAIRAMPWYSRQEAAWLS